MYFVYNPQGLGDVVLAAVDHAPEGERVVERAGDAVLIRRREDGTLVGINLFRFSQYATWPVVGVALASQERVDRFNAALAQAGVGERLTFVPRIVVGRVVEKAPHPQADKLSVCRVDVGDGRLRQIVCGAPNVAAGQTVVVALPGAVLPNGLRIQPAQLRGVDSEGMICAARELGMKGAPQQKGILVLDERAYPVGAPFAEHDYAQVKRGA